MATIILYILLTCKVIFQTSTTGGNNQQVADCSQSGICDQSENNIQQPDTNQVDCSTDTNQDDCHTNNNEVDCTTNNNQADCSTDSNQDDRRANNNQEDCSTNNNQADCDTRDNQGTTTTTSTTDNRPTIRDTTTGGTTATNNRLPEAGAVVTSAPVLVGVGIVVLGAIFAYRKSKKKSKH